MVREDDYLSPKLKSVAHFFPNSVRPLQAGYSKIAHKMAKKRKANGQPFAQNNGKRVKQDDESRLAINTFEDVADSEDEFHLNRDKILLEETPAQKKQRIAQEEG